MHAAGRRSARRKYEVEDEGSISSDAEDSEGDISDHVEAQPEEKEESEKICASTAVSQYGVRRSDLDLLDCDLVKNPHYRSAAPMRLYMRAEVKKLAKEAERFKAIEKALRKEDAERRKEEAKEAALRAKETVRGFAPFSKVPKNSGLSTAWPIILPRMVEQFCKGKLMNHYDTKELMLSLESLALTCEEMSQLVTELALPALAPKVDPSPWARKLIPADEDGRLPAMWDEIIRDPTACKLTSLKAAAKHLGMAQVGTKDELILQIYKWFGMKGMRPRQMPAAIAFAMREPGRIVYRQSTRRHPLDKFTSRAAAEAHWQRIQEADAALP